MVLKKEAEGILLTISGQPGVGKDTIINFVIKNSNFSRLPGYTTRPPRKEEICGFHYHFVIDEEFINAPKRFLTIILANGYYYGYKLEEIEKNIKGGKNIIIQPLAENIKLVKQKVKNTISVLINPPSPETLVERMKKRGTQEKEITSRLKNRRLMEFTNLCDYDLVVVNQEGLAELIAKQIVELVFSKHAQSI